jgi:exo-beta-1,3-glucanase (GH17 family)
VSRPTFLLIPALALLFGLTTLIWWLPNRPATAGPPITGEIFNSLSFAPYRRGESPLTGAFPTRAEVAQDMAVLAPRTRALRTYAAIEGDYDIAAMAHDAGLKLWQGIWLGSDRTQNTREIDRAITNAQRYPDTIERVVVGNEVLLRRDLPLAELIADIDRVKAAVHQPVTYADVWEFWLRFPQLAAHVDAITVHILPYWEDVPTGIDHAIDHLRDIYQLIRQRFPGKPVVIGETGWPSRGRWRQDAAPSRINQALFLRRFIALAGQLGFDYNLIEAFDQIWKYQSEGIVGANWGLWDAARQPKFPLSGPVVEDPAWRGEAALSAAVGAVLLACVMAAIPRLGAASQLRLAVLAIVLGNALGFAWVTTIPDLYDRYVQLAAAANLTGQCLLAWLLLHRAGLRLTGLNWLPQRSGAHATATMRHVLTLQLDGVRTWREWLFDDLSFLFAWTAAVLQLLLVFDPRYRDFPIATFATPLVAVLARAWLGELRRGYGGREELCVGLVLVLGAIASTIREGPDNLQSLAWNASAVLLAAPLWISCMPRRRTPDPAPDPQRRAEHTPARVIVQHPGDADHHR